MRGQAKSVYVTLLKMGKGDIPYNQAADERAAQLEASVPTIPKVFAPNPKEDVVNATYGSSPKIWQNKADFDSRVPPVIKAVADLKGKIKDQASAKMAYERSRTGATAATRLSAQAEIASRVLRRGRRRSFRIRGRLFGLHVEQAPRVGRVEPCKPSSADRGRGSTRPFASSSPAMPAVLQTSSETTTLQFSVLVMS